MESSQDEQHNVNEYVRIDEGCRESSQEVHLINPNNLFSGKFQDPFDSESYLELKDVIRKIVSGQGISVLDSEQNWEMSDIVSKLNEVIDVVNLRNVNSSSKVNVEPIDGESDWSVSQIVMKLNEVISALG